MNKLKKSSPYNILTMLALILLALSFLFPLYWIITGSFKSQMVAVSATPAWFPLEPTVDNYIRLFKNPAVKWLTNTVFVSLASMVLVLLTASLAGYTLAKKRFYGRAFVFALIIASMALPKQVVLVPLVRIMDFLKLSDNPWAVILPTVGWPFGIFLMKQFSESIPNEVLESARIDGAGELRTFVSIVTPIIKPAFGALGIFTFINTWNDYFLQLIMLRSRANLTISLGIATLQSEYATNYGLQMPGAALGSIPIILIFIFFQKYFTQGITMGAVKG